MQPRFSIGTWAWALLGSLSAGCQRCQCPTDVPGETLPVPAPAAVDLGPGVFTVEATDGAAARVRVHYADVLTVKPGLVGSEGGFVDFNEVDPGPTNDFRFEVPSIDVELSGTIRPGDQPGVLVMHTTLVARRDLPRLGGGGMIVTYVDDPAIFAAQPPAPVALEQDKGLDWDTPLGRVRVEFESSLARIDVDEQRRTVQCAWFVDSLSAGTYEFSTRVILPDGGQVVPSLAQRYAAIDRATWRPKTMPWDWTPVDLSFLNADDRPAGQHGSVRVEGDHFIRGDGKPLRLWGTNITAYALLGTSDEAIDRHARRLAALGYNLVRLHHHDSAWVEPNVFDVASGTTENLREQALDRIDRWIAALEAQGIYVWLDLHVGRVMLPGDRVEARDELFDGKLLGLNYVASDLSAAMERFAKRYLDRVNKYTRRRIADDPGVFAVLITNENDITHHFGNLMDADGSRPVHRRQLEAKFKQFAARTGLDVVIPPRPWQFGPTRMALSEVEAQFFVRARTQLYSFGYDGVTVTTSFWGDEGLHSLPSLLVGDVVDFHSYGGPEGLGTNPHVEPHFLSYIASAATLGYPTSISEWAIPAPTRDRFIAPLWMAAVASFQDYDAPLHYAYSQTPLDVGRARDPWTTVDDPATQATMPAAALLFRRSDVAVGPSLHVLKADRDAIWGRATTVWTSALPRTAVERYRFRVSVPEMAEFEWDRGVPVPQDAVTHTDPREDLLAGDSTTVESEGGQLRRDWAHGTFTIDTKGTAAALGWIGGRAIELTHARFAIETPGAAIAVSSLDGADLAKSQRILLTTVAQATPSLDPSETDYWAQPVRGTVTLRCAIDRPVLRPIRSPGAGKAEPVAGKNIDGWCTWRLPQDGVTHWWLIEGQ